jgi:hypothetical protein
MRSQTVDSSGQSERPDPAGTPNAQSLVARRRGGAAAIAGVVGVGAAAALSTAPTVAAVFAGMNLGNHNETVLDSAPPRRRRRRTTPAAATVTGVLIVGLTLGFSTSPGDGFGSSPGHAELALPGQYTTSSGGGGDR